MMKTLLIGRMDNFKTFFKNGNSCANAYFSRKNAKTESNYILNSPPNVIELHQKTKVQDIDFVLGFVSY